jgi:hypothetical protein
MRLVIVYNANAGLLAGAMDSIHKLAAPATYPCKLCALTYGLVSMRREWRAFLDGLGTELLFHHRPDFRAAFPQVAEWPLPLIAVEQDGQLTVLVRAADFASIADLPQLMAVVARRLPGAANSA